MPQARDVFERAVLAVSEQAAAADVLGARSDRRRTRRLPSRHAPRQDAPTRTPEHEGRPGTRAGSARARLHVMRTKGALGRGPRCHAWPLGAQGARSAPRARHLALAGVDLSELSTVGREPDERLDPRDNFFRVERFHVGRRPESPAQDALWVIRSGRENRAGSDDRLHVGKPPYAYDRLCGG